jgi:hypothetical protein
MAIKEMSRSRTPEVLFFFKKIDLFCGDLGLQADIRRLLCLDDPSRQEFRPFLLRRLRPSENLPTPHLLTSHGRQLAVKKYCVCDGFSLLVRACGRQNIPVFL